MQDQSTTNRSTLNRRNIYTPTELNQATRLHLEAGFPTLWLEGEVSNLSRPASGHIYFTIKDDRAQIRCALFRNKSQPNQHIFKHGDKVIVRGRISLYEARGDYQLIAELVEPAGAGQLQQQFEALKKKLQTEGLFATEKKQTLPPMPTKIAVISSASGAAIKDFLQVLQRRWPLAKILLYNSLVQGKKASNELRKALQQASSDKETEVIVLTRGGGSLEDLWAFNDETLAREVAACPIPTVAAVGHEIDFTIVDFVADVRAPTPSAAAELISPNIDTLRQQIQLTIQRFIKSSERTLQNTNQQFDYMTRRLHQQHPTAQLNRRNEMLLHYKTRLKRQLQASIEQQQVHLSHLLQRYHQNTPSALNRLRLRQLKQLQQRCQQAIQRQLLQAKQILQLQQKNLQSLGPDSILQRGYALVLDEQQRVLQHASQFNQDQHLGLQFSSFTVTTKVIDIHPDIKKPPIK